MWNYRSDSDTTSLNCFRQLETAFQPNNFTESTWKNIHYFLPFRFGLKTDAQNIANRGTTTNQLKSKHRQAKIWIVATRKPARKSALPYQFLQALFTHRQVLQPYRNLHQIVCLLFHHSVRIHQQHSLLSCIMQQVMIQKYVITARISYNAAISAKHPYSPHSIRLVTVCLTVNPSAPTAY